MPRKKPRPAPDEGFSREAVIAYIQDNPAACGRRDIARAFGLRRSARKALNEMLREIEDEGRVPRRRKRRLSQAAYLPDSAVVEITAIDGDGEPLARPLNWSGKDDPPRIVMLPERGGRGGRGGLAIGDRVLARLTKAGADGYEGRTLRRIPRPPSRVLGIYRTDHGEGRLIPTDRRVKLEFRVSRIDSKGARDGDLVLAEATPGRRQGLPHARITELVGASLNDPRSFSLIAIHANQIPVDFSDAAIAEAEAAKPLSDPADREDLRHIPFITIDGAEARDFDDAVWAEPDGEGGWHAMVAIADVAYYVRPGGALDRDAVARGNSVYFPDRVAPMLPEALSNGLCSLKPGEPRPVLAVHLWIDGDGGLVRHRTLRGLMRSAARLTYEQVQAARDGHSADLSETVIAPLYGVLAALDRARSGRGAIDLDLPERLVTLGDDGHVESVAPRARLDSHRLIEELMICANVAAAETLEQRRMAAMYRIHDEPGLEKIAELSDFLAGFGIKLAAGQRPRPGYFNRILAQVAGAPHAPAVNTAILRSQAKAEYSPDNIGHFGLNLSRYCHFTSPIRRYADLLVHRALIAALDLGAGGLPEGAGDRFGDLGEKISATERRAQKAEREAMDRYMAAYMEDRIGAVFAGRVSGVTRFGLFVTLDETGADGIVPRRSLGAHVEVDEAARTMTAGGRTIRLGDPVEVRLRQAEVATGSLAFELLSGGREKLGKKSKPRRKHRRKP